MNNKKNAIFVIFITIMVFGLLVVNDAETKLNTTIPQDVAADTLNAVVIEDFEAGQDYQIESEPRKNPDPKKDPAPVLEIKYISGGPSDLAAEKLSASNKGMEKERILGVHFRFKYPGNNNVSLLPPPEVQWDDPAKAVMTYDPKTGTEIRERAIQIPGRAKGLSIWVHGRGHEYYLEAWVKDWTGDTHVVSFGSIDFVGWRPVKAWIPPSIPQTSNSYPQTKVLKITRLVIRSAPQAPVEDVYVFFDQLKALTETFEANFDGLELTRIFEGGAAPSTVKTKPRTETKARTEVKTQPGQKPGTAVKPKPGGSKPGGARPGGARPGGGRPGGGKPRR